MSRLCFVAPLIAACASILSAQEFRGTITGQITDPQGAAIAGAKIVATLVATGARSETVSTVEGRFTIPFLSPGEYRVEIQVSGFKRYVRDKFSVGSGEKEVL